MELATISLIISGSVGIISALNFINTLVVNRKNHTDKLAKASDVDSKINHLYTDFDNYKKDIKDQISSIKKDTKDQISSAKDMVKECINSVEDDWKNHEDKIQELRTKNAVMESFMEIQVKAVDRINDKIDELGK